MKTLATVLAVSMLALPFTARAEDPHAQHDMKGMDDMTCKQGMKCMENMKDMKDMKAMGGDTSESSKAFADVNMKMHKNMTMEFTGNPDVDFAQGMIPHHQGAIGMANVVLKYGKDPEMKKLAEEIIKAQDTEIAVMKAWLAKQPK
ncbi:MAG: DUF305 domain-containing protein [Hyphomicrobium sp.]|nr:DUF305 domain-containing protein [Hyphomicrobium sp.]